MPNINLPNYLATAMPAFPDPYPSIKLVFADNELWLWEFAEGNGYDRKQPKAGSLDYSNAGTPIIRQIPYKPKWLWTINAYCSLVARQVFWAIIEASQNMLQNPPFDDYAIVLHDLARPIVETTKTRAIADNWNLIVGSSVSYFAQFNVLIPRESVAEMEVGANRFQLSFTMMELSTKSTT